MSQSKSPSRAKVLFCLYKSAMLRAVGVIICVVAATDIYSLYAAAIVPTSQLSVYSQGKNHALFLWIELEPAANANDVAKAAKNLQMIVDQVTNPNVSTAQDEIWAGVGFSPTFFKQVGGKAIQDFSYTHRRGNLGEMPSTPGDLFVHAKCNTPSKLFELAEAYLASFPNGSVRNYEDIYSFVYRNGRDLSGFIDGTMNAKDEWNRRRIAVQNETGGSYVVTQKWIHDMEYIRSEEDAVLEQFVGRTKNDSIELNPKAVTSHVTRMRGGGEIVRQSMPFGTLNGGAGLFFIGYSASPDTLNFMLDRMVGAGMDSHSDDIMRLSRNVKGTYWYFPGVEELATLPTR